MKISAKWLAFLMTAAITCANLTLPQASVTAFGAQTASEQQGSTEEGLADENTAEQALNAQTPSSDQDDSADASSDEASRSKNTDDALSAEEGESSGDINDAGSSADGKNNGEDTDSSESVTENQGTEETPASSDTSSEASSGTADKADSDEEAQGASDAETIGSDGSDEEGNVSDTEDTADTADAADAANTGESSENADSSADPSVDSTADSAADSSADPAAGTGEAASEEQSVITSKRELQTVDPDDNPFADMDNEEAFAGYVNRELELTGDLRADEGDIADTADRLEKDYAGSKLTGYQKTLYNLLSTQISNVAAGSVTNTHFVITAAQLGLSGKTWTAAQLGVSAIVVNGSISYDAIEALEERLGISSDDYFNDIVMRLVYDKPYDLYWYDKTMGSPYASFGYTANWVNNHWVLTIDPSFAYLDCIFPVCAEYSATGETNTWKTNSSIGTSVTAARNNARSIVNKYAGKTDYEKLDGYRKEIINLVDYNDDAAENSYSLDYGNPWQLIWTFDGDSSTKVVCEGYSKSFQYLCDLSSWSSIFRECICVTGDMGFSGNTGAHMWNIVSLKDGRSFLVDITNCDTNGIGSGNSGRDLFLVGVGSASAGQVYAQGSVSKGYTFAALSNLGYRYDSNTLSVFNTAILTLASGRVNSSTKLYQRLSLKYDSKIPANTTTKLTVSNIKETSKYTHTSSNTSVAPISSSGIVTGKKAGTVTITVTTPATKNYYAGKVTIKITVINALKKPGYCHFVKWNNAKYNSCRIAWNKTAGAQGYQTLLSWTNGTHATWKSTKSGTLYRTCSVAVNHVSQIKVRAFFDTNTGRKYGPWSNVEYITPSPTKLTKKNVSTSSKNLQMKIGWNIIYGCNGYNVFITTNPKSTWYWNQSTAVNATATSATVSKYRGSKLKKYTNYYVRIVTRRKRNGVFCTVPMPAANTNIGYFVFK